MPEIDVGKAIYWQKMKTNFESDVVLINHDKSKQRGLRMTSIHREVFWSVSHRVDDVFGASSVNNAYVDFHYFQWTGGTLDLASLTQPNISVATNVLTRYVGKPFGRACHRHLQVDKILKWIAKLISYIKTATKKPISNLQRFKKGWRALGRRR